MAGAGAGGLHADHGTRRNIATSAERSACAPESGQEASVSDGVNDNLTSDPLFPHSGSLLKSVMSEEAIQTRSFCLRQSLLIHSPPVSSSPVIHLPLALQQKRPKELHLKLPNAVVVGKGS